MSEYWKSLPKKFCDVCKCWFADNKASVEFHERGLRHQNNVRKKLTDLQKRGSKEQKELEKFNSEIMKIEAAAMSAFAKDVASDPSKAKEYSSTKSMINTLNYGNKKAPVSTGSRFGDDSNDDSSRYLALGKEKALEAITKKMEQKALWLESKTAEGQSFYWNKKTFETRWEPPKEGFLSAEEQQKMNVRSNSSMIAPPKPLECKYSAHGRWQQVEDKVVQPKMPDLQLPSSEYELSSSEKKILEIIDIDKDEKFDFKEKTLDTITSSNTASSSSTSTLNFKKRKTENTGARNIRKRGN